MCSIRSADSGTHLGPALDALRDEDVFALGETALLDRTLELVSAANRIAAELARTVRRAELARAAEGDGLTSMASWLRGHARMSAGAAGRLVGAGRALEHLPVVAERHAAGLVSAEQVTVLAAVVAPDKLTAAAAHGVDVAPVDDVLADIASTAPFRRLGAVVHHYLARLDPDGPEPDPTEQRALSLATLADGTLFLRGRLDPVGGEKLQAALESIVQANRPAGDTRTRVQRQADALVQLCDNQLAAGMLPFLRTVKPHLLITLASDDLTDRATGPATAQAAFGAPLSASRARQAACDATVTRIVLDPDGLPLDVGRSQRVVPPHLRRAVENRDRQCVFAGCHAPTHWCDVHHLLAWALGGDTSLDNSGLLCERHHTQVHSGYRIDRGADGRWHTYRPDGSEIVIPRSPPATARETGGQPTEEGFGSLAPAGGRPPGG